MPARDPQAVLQRLGQTTLKVDTYFLQRTGFVANQTVLRLGEYNLHCVPATIGVIESRLLAVLTPSEVNHFAKFKGGTQILLLAFDDPDNKDIARFPLRVSLTDLIVVPERKNVCFLVVKAKSFPSEFILFLGDYLDELESRKAAWETCGVDPIPLSTEGLAAWNGTGVLVADVESNVRAREFHTKLIQLEGGPGTEIPVAHLRLKVRNRPLVLEGRLDGDAGFHPEFHPDWLSFVEDLKFQKSMKSRTTARKNP